MTKDEINSHAQRILPKLRSVLEEELKGLPIEAGLLVMERVLEEALAITDEARQHLIKLKTEMGA